MVAGVEAKAVTTVVVAVVVAVGGREETNH